MKVFNKKVFSLKFSGVDKKSINFIHTTNILEQNILLKTSHFLKTMNPSGKQRNILR